MLTHSNKCTAFLEAIKHPLSRIGSGSLEVLGAFSRVPSAIRWIALYILYNILLFIDYLRLRDPELQLRVYVVIAL